MAERALEDLVARLERERLEADRHYSDALTTLDRALARPPHTFPVPPAAADDGRLRDANLTWDILPGGAPSFDRSIKGRLGAFIWRLIGPPLDAQRRFNAAIVEHLNRSAAWDRQTSAGVADLVGIVRQECEALVRFQSLLVQYLQTVTAYVDTKDRSLGGPELRQQIVIAQERTLALKRELERLGSGRGERRSEATPTSHEGPAAETESEAFTYVGFEDRFRGSREEITGRLRDYVPLLAGASNVLDVGCGRGELLALMREGGISARGIDGNREMVEVCRERGLAAEHADALAHLAGLADSSLGGVTAIQVVEHFEPRYLAKFLEAAYHAMRPGAPLILETINPACWMAFFETYIRDLTHARPLHPDTLRFLVQASGFTSIDVSYRAPVGEADRLPRVDTPAPADSTLTPLVAVLNAHADRLNARLFGSMDYVLTARRPARDIEG